MIKVVTESVADLPEDLVRQWGIHTVPYLITWDGATYLDGVELTPARLYDAMHQGIQSVSTSFPPSTAFEELYRRAAEGADGIVSVHISGGLSGGYAQAAQTASQLTDLPPIRAVDSRTISMAEGYVAMAAAKRAAQGGTLDEVAAAAEKARDEVDFLAAVDTLEYLFRGGRLKRSTYLIGSALRIKPLIGTVNGLLQPIGRARNSGQALKKVAAMVEERARGKTLHLTVVHAGNPEGAEELLGAIKAVAEPVDGYIGQITPALGAHGGPGLVAACIWAEGE